MHIYIYSPTYQKQKQKNKQKKTLTNNKTSQKTENHSARNAKTNATETTSHLFLIVYLPPKKSCGVSLWFDYIIE